MTCPNSEILLFNKSGVNKVNYFETEHYTLTQHFLNAPEKFISEIL